MDGNTARHPIMSAIFPKRGESPPATARHRCLVTKHQKKYQVTEHFVLAWLGALMSIGAFFNGDNNRGVEAVYSNASYGVSLLFIQNTMPKNAFVFLRTTFTSPAPKIKSLQANVVMIHCSRFGELSICSWGVFVLFGLLGIA